MAEITFAARGLPERFAQIEWANQNGIPLVISFTFANSTQYRGSRWLLKRYAKNHYTAFGTPRHLGGLLLLRERDVPLWLLRWGVVE